MADISHWLRSLQRNRPSTPIVASTPVDDSFSSTEDNMSSRSRPISVSRMSSYLNSFGRSSTVSASPSEVEHAQPVRDPDSTWHNPEPDAVAETLLSVMMTRDSFASVPTEYNSCILQVLEAYHNLSKEVSLKDSEILDLTSARESYLQDFEELASQWNAKEQDYKAEIRRLEVALASGKSGLDVVTGMRSNSKIYHGSNKDAKVTQLIERISRRAQQNSSSKEHEANIHESPESYLSNNYVRSAEVLQSSGEGSDTGKVVDKGRGKRRQKEPFDEDVQSHRQDSSNYGHLNKSNTTVRTSKDLPLQPPQQLQSSDRHCEGNPIAFDDDKPLPSVPTVPHTINASHELGEGETSSLQAPKSSLSRRRQGQGRFSFVPGDDHTELYTSPQHRLSKEFLRDSDQEKIVEASTVNKNEELPRTRVSMSRKSRPPPLVLQLNTNIADPAIPHGQGLGLSRVSQEQLLPKRDGSKSSTGTVIRNDSAKKRQDSLKGKWSKGSGESKHQIEQNENIAIIAANRAAGRGEK